MLAHSDKNPLAANEARAFQDDEEIMAMQTLQSAYKAKDFISFERTLENEANRILAEPFIMEYVKPLQRRMREQVRVTLVNPVQRTQTTLLRSSNSGRVTW
jgi:hypothetical protein